MPRRSESPVRPAGTPSLSNYRDDATLFRGEEGVSPLGSFKWLEELRFRFDLAIEVIDRQLEYVLISEPETGRAVDIRAAFKTGVDPTLREAAGTVLRSGKARSLTAGSLRVRMFPLSSGFTIPRTIVGFLLVADASAADAAGASEIDHRLDSAGQWLVAALEAAIVTTDISRHQSRSAERLAGVIDVVEAVSALEKPRQVLELMVEAIALWYDADARAYRQNASGAFVQEIWLPGADPNRAPQTLAAGPIWDRTDVFHLESAHELDDLGWDPRTPDTLFIPLSVDGSVEWLIAVSGGVDRSIETTLRFLRRIVSLRLTALERGAADLARRRLTAILALGDASFSAIVSMSLQAIAQDVGASSAQLTIYYEGNQAPALTVHWGQLDRQTVAPLQPETTIATAEDTVFSMVVGAGVSAVFAFHSARGEFSTSAARVGKEGTAILASWLSGAFLGRGEIRTPTSGDRASELARRLEVDLDKSGRLKIAGVLAVVLAEPPRPASMLGPRLDEVLQLVYEQVRPSDIIGTVADAGAGVLLRDVAPDAATAIVDRFTRAAERRGLVGARVGSVAFHAFSENPTTLLERAIASAHRGPSVS